MVGKTISHYKVLEKIGQGGMGEVYLAKDTTLDRKVALKFLLEELEQDTTARKRFLREAKSAAALDHPYICHIHEVGEVEGTSFISMEYVQGETLKDKLAQGPLPLNDALEKATEIAEALEEAHKQGIVHRDLKPSNIMLTPQGHVKVMDFGLAKRVSPVEGQEEEITTALTREGSTLGTLPYMSPEQIRGQAVDTQSDIFSFGVVLFEMLTGVHPFKKASPLDTASSILRDEPSPLSDYVPELPEVLQHTVQKMLAKRVEDRCQSAAEVRIDLEQLTAGVPFIPGRLRLTRRQMLALTGLIMVAALTTLVGLDVGGWRGWLSQLLGVGGAPRIESIAVLSLENVSGDPDQDYFADGMTEALTTALGKIGALRVISRTSVMQFKGANRPLAEIAQELNVDAVVEGSAQRVGQEAGINVRLVHAATEEQLWSQSYQRDLSDLLRLQSEVAQAIARQIEIAVTAEEEARLEATREINREVYEAYLRGTFYLNQGTPESIRRGLEHLRQAVEIDPADPLAYAGLALGYSLSASHGPWAPEEAFMLAKGAAIQALQLDETLADAHAALAQIRLYRDWDWPGAEQAFRRALELNPSLAPARAHYAMYLTLFGRQDEAVAEIQRAHQVDPLNPLLATWIGDVHWAAGDYDKAIEAFQKSLEVNPDFPWALRMLGFAYDGKGMYEEAIAMHEKAAARNPSMKADLAYSYALAGRRDEALKIAAEVEKGDSRSKQSNLARIYTALGETDEAFRWLDAAYENRHPTTPWLKIPPFYPLRDDPRFDDLLHRLNLPPP